MRARRAIAVAALTRATPEGYTLVTFMTVVAFVDRLNEENMLQSAKETLSQLVDDSVLTVDIH